VRGLSHNHNPDLKNLFKGAAISASSRPGPLYDFYAALLEKGMRPTMARLTLAFFSLLAVDRPTLGWRQA